MHLEDFCQLTFEKILTRKMYNKQLNLFKVINILFYLFFVMAAYKREREKHVSNRASFVVIIKQILHFMHKDLLILEYFNYTI